MAPEQASGERVGQADRRVGRRRNALRVAAGRPPNQGTTAEAFAVARHRRKYRRSVTVAPRIPSDLATIVMKCLEPRPERRYPSVAGLDDLRRYLAGDPIAARPPSLVYRRANGCDGRGASRSPSVPRCGPRRVLASCDERATAERRLTEKKLRIAQRFGQEVSRIETFMRQAYAAPLHDIRPEQQHVLDRMTALRRKRGARRRRDRSRRVCASVAAICRCTTTRTRARISRRRACGLRSAGGKVRPRSSRSRRSIKRDR